MTEEEFKTETCKKRGKKHFKVTGSWGVRDAYKAIRKNGWKGIGRPLTEHEFYTIIRTMNKCIADKIAEGVPIVLPARMGILELRRFARGASIKDGKLKVSYPIDWKATLELWYKDNEMKQNKVLIRKMDGVVYRIVYNKRSANYRNKSCYKFSPVRSLRQKLRQKIEAGEVYSGY